MSGKRYFYDCEFIEDGRTIELVSIGVVSDDGREFYAINGGVHWERLGKQQFQWVRENVWRFLPTTGPGQLSLNRYHTDVKTKFQIGQELLAFFFGQAPEGHEPEIELWGDYPAYGHVALCQIWGSMLDKPRGIPMQTNCLVQLGESLGIKEHNFPKQDEATKHHALYDARHHKVVFDSIHPEAFRQHQIPRRGEEGNPSVSLVTLGKTYGGRRVTDTMPRFPE